MREDRHAELCRPQRSQRVETLCERVHHHRPRPQLDPNRAPGRSDWERLSRSWETRIDERIGELERLKNSLGECIGCGCLSLDRCQLANPGDRAARFGSGPRYWIGDRAVR